MKYEAKDVLREGHRARKNGEVAFGIFRVEIEGEQAFTLRVETFASDEHRPIFYFRGAFLIAANDIAETTVREALEADRASRAAVVPYCIRAADLVTVGSVKQLAWAHNIVAGLLRSGRPLPIEKALDDFAGRMAGGDGPEQERGRALVNARERILSNAGAWIDGDRLIDDLYRYVRCGLVGSSLGRLKIV